MAATAASARYPECVEKSLIHVQTDLDFVILIEQFVDGLTLSCQTASWTATATTAASVTLTTCHAW